MNSESSDNSGMRSEHSPQSPLSPASGPKESDLQDLSALDPSKILDSITDQRRKAFFYELFTGLGLLPLNSADSRPKWVLNAWKEFWRSLAIIPETGQNNSDFAQVGSIVGLISDLEIDSLQMPEPLEGMIKQVIQRIPQIRILAANSSAKEAKDFFCAQHQGQEKRSLIEQPSQRTKIFVVIAIAWRDIAQLKSTSALYGWLISKKVIQPSGDQTGKGGTDSREIRKICKMIGLRYSTQTS